MQNYIEQELEKTNRPGIDKLIDYLKQSDFYTAPASTKFHGNFKTGLVKHSYSVYENFYRLNKELKLEVPEPSVILTSLLHDVCKIGAYKENTKSYTWNKDQPKGHGRLSTERIKKCIDLTELEEALILYHMGPWNTIQFMGVGKGEYTLLELTTVWNRLKATRFLYFADEMATITEEVKLV